ncbi:MAG TPA: FliH/SctL family protein [Candidatus Gastranaerophilaceae bacterium]|nr:FliH/SctL family protein [Candidatus Gastranaerophilaceae bacterium]HPT40902.1 FliH/SctL family protein [Candidatus Gastranaerophilaceae bacterium]
MIIKKNKSHNQKTEQKTSGNTAAQIIEEKIDLFDLDNIDFSQRQERRRGDRRRGYRRIDERGLVSRAQEEAGAIKETAFQQGYREGLEKAQSDVEKLRISLEEFMKAKQEVFEYVAPDILEIGVDIARKIIKKETQQDPQILLDTVLDILKTISKDESRITIKVNPAEVAFVKENIAKIIEKTGIDARVSVAAAEETEIGDCIVYTNNGVVDATIDTQLEIIKEAFKGI